MDFREESYEERMRCQLGDPNGLPHRQLIVLPWIIWCLVIIASIATAVLVSGCSSAAIEGVCAVQPIGQNEAGVTIVRYRCEPNP